MNDREVVDVELEELLEYTRTFDTGARIEGTSDGITYSTRHIGTSLPGRSSIPGDNSDSSAWWPLPHCQTSPQPPNPHTASGRSSCPVVAAAGGCGCPQGLDQAGPPCEGAPGALSSPPAGAIQPGAVTCPHMPRGASEALSSSAEGIMSHLDLGSEPSAICEDDAP